MRGQDQANKCAGVVSVKTIQLSMSCDLSRATSDSVVSGGSMHRAILVMLVSVYVFCGLATGGHRPDALASQEAAAVDRPVLSAWLTSLAATGEQGHPLPGFDTCQTPSLRTMRA